MLAGGLEDHFTDSRELYVNRKVAAESLSSYSSTLKLNIMPLSWCSAMWQ